MVRHSFLFRRVVNRFIAGETLEEALKVVEDLTNQGFYVTLDYLGENTNNEQEAVGIRNTYIEMLERISASACSEKTNISIKLTQCGLDLSDAIAESNLRSVLEAAATMNKFVRVDMEGSAYTQRTIEMMERVWRHCKNTGTALQTYLYRTPKDVELMISMQMRTRLVKGAYLEPPSIAHSDKKKVDEAYMECAQRLMDSGNYPAFATHDERIIRNLRAHARLCEIDRDRFEFQMLFGIRRDLQRELLTDGYNMRIYVPFGRSWYPYFMRRLAERPANVGFILKSLFKR